MDAPFKRSVAAAAAAAAAPTHPLSKGAPGNYQSSSPTPLPCRPHRGLFAKSDAAFCNSVNYHAMNVVRGSFGTGRIVSRLSSIGRSTLIWYIHFVATWEPVCEWEDGVIVHDTFPAATLFYTRKTNDVIRWPNLRVSRVRSRSSHHKHRRRRHL